MRGSRGEILEMLLLFFSVGPVHFKGCLIWLRVVRRDRGTLSFLFGSFEDVSRRFVGVLVGFWFLIPEGGTCPSFSSCWLVGVGCVKAAGAFIGEGEVICSAFATLAL